MKSTTRVRAADRAFFASLFGRVAAEMGGALARAAYSPNIKERRDFSCALFDADGAMIAQAAHIPVHLGAMPLSVHHALQTFPTWAPGDLVLLNDPYAGGTHLPDITSISPVFATRRARRPIAFLATRAHHADVGGQSPGSLPLATDIVQEGLRLPPVKWYAAGQSNEAITTLIMANTRTPDERRGDLMAQRAAHAIGERRLDEAVRRYGVKMVTRQMRDLLAYGEDLMRALIQRMPDGRYTFRDVLDGDGIDAAPLPIVVAIEIDGHRVHVDFSGTASACRGSLNAVEAITQAAVYYCFLCLLVTPSELSGGLQDPPLNAGCFRPIDITIPAGSLLNADPPHAVAGGNVETSQRIVDVVFGALAQAVPDVIPAAAQGTMNNMTLGGIDPRTGAPFSYYETIGGGSGAGPSQAGMHAVQTHMTNTLNTPIEALEFAYPFRVRAYQRISGSGGAGRYRGGDGIRRELELLAPATGVLLTERREYPPYGLHGGSPGRCGRNEWVRDGKRRLLPGKTNLQLEPGDRLVIQTPGGGGHGSP